MDARLDHAGLVTGGTSTCYVTHDTGKGKPDSIDWSATAFQRVFRKGNFEPYTQLNAYWAQMDRRDQDHLFNLYLEAKDICNNVHDVMKLMLAIRPVIHEILKFHDTDGFDRWVRQHARIWIPDEMDQTYTQDYERPRSREQTYLVGDYWELVYMVMRLRTIAPVLGEFVEKTRRESGKFTELNCGRLLTKSCVDVSPAMERLRAYVSKNLKETDYTARNAIEGFGSDDFQPNLIADILVRYLILANLTSEMNDTHLVQIVHKTLRNRLSGNENHQTQVLPKLNPRDESDSEDASSRAEKYKNRPQVAPGIFVAIEKDTEYMTKLASKLLDVDRISKEDRELLDSAHESAMKTIAIPLAPCQTRLIQIACNPIVSARAGWDINKAAVTRMAAIAQFVYWKAGFKDFAGIVTARSHDNGDDYQFATESRSHIPKELQKRLDELYPYQKRHPLKKNFKAVNDAIEEIIVLSAGLSEYTWYLNLSDELTKEARGSSVNRTYRVGQDIRVRLAEMVIFIQERNQAFLKLQQR